MTTFCVASETGEKNIIADVNTEETVNHLEYVVRSGDSLNKIASRHRKLTNHYGMSDLLNDIIASNGLESNLILPGQRLVIPIVEEQPYEIVGDPVSDGHNLRGIYLTGPACGFASIFPGIDRFIAAGGNGIVFDVKDIDGGVSYRSGMALARPGKGRSAPFIPSMPEMMQRFEKRQLYVIGRIALFLDGELGRQRPDLALVDSDGAPWTERGCTWIDPSLPEVQAYNIGLAMELAAAGVDEIQFDYVRFPTNGWRGDWTGDLETTAARRRSVIAGFLQAAQDSLDRYDVQISADLYGIMGWGRIEDLAMTGQHVPTFAAHVDIICPMIYPSHFAPGFEGFDRPGDYPDYFISEGVRRFHELAGDDTLIRPWLQAFPYRVTNYDGTYIAAQILAVDASDGSGWCLWNPACRYRVANEILPEIYTGAGVAVGQVPDAWALP